MIFLSSLASNCQGQAGRLSKPPDSDTVRVLKEYGIDSVLLSTSRQQMINGCWRELQYRRFDKSGNLELERTTRYESGKNNTCDFTPYIEYNRVYINRKLYKEYSRQAACDECDVGPCGVEKHYMPSGKAIYQRNHGKCNFKAVIHKSS